MGSKRQALVQNYPSKRQEPEIDLQAAWKKNHAELRKKQEEEARAREQSAAKRQSVPKPPKKEPIAEPKYTLLMDAANTMTTPDGHFLHRICAARDFGQVHEGDIGGWVESEANLSHSGDCWIFDDAKAYGGALVTNNAILAGNAQAHGHVRVQDFASLHNNANVYGDSKSGICIIAGCAKIRGNAEVKGYPKIFGAAHVHEYARVDSNAQIWGNASVGGFVYIGANTKIHGEANINGTGQYRNCTLGATSPDFGGAR